MLWSRGVVADSTLGSALKSERRWRRARLSVRSSVLLIGGVNLFLWALIIEAGIHFLR